MLTDGREFSVCFGQFRQQVSKLILIFLREYSRKNRSFVRQLSDLFGGSFQVGKRMIQIRLYVDGLV